MMAVKTVEAEATDDTTSEEVLSELDTGEANEVEKGAADALAEALEDSEGAETDDGEASGDEVAKDKASGEEDDSDLEVAFTGKQLEALKFAKIDPATLQALGADGLKIAQRLADVRTAHDQLASKVGNLEAKLGKTGKADEEKAEDWKPPVIAVDEFEESEGLQTKINAALADMHAQFASRLQAFGKAEQDSSAQEAVDAATTRANDAFFDGLDGRTWSRFGKGPLSNYAEGSPEAVARQEVVGMANTIQADLLDRGVSITGEQALDKALAALHTEDYAQWSVAKARADAQKRRRGTPEAPSGRHAGKTSSTLEEQIVVGLAEQLGDLDE